ncbi:MAG TPA: hypothetical protein ACFYEL_01790 [Candidatus Wunengus californicus]|uniref:hypothetical protein n=1 Tax=Candidatus Wunengus californicus TaxID=3367619 RepID=UPI004025B6B0
MPDQREDTNPIDELREDCISKINDHTRILKDSYVKAFRYVNCKTIDDGFRKVESVMQGFENLSNLPRKISDIKDLRISIELELKHHALAASKSHGTTGRFFTRIYNKFEDIIGSLNETAQTISKISKSLLEEIKKCPFGEAENSSLNAKRFERNVIELIQWLFIDEIVRIALPLIEDGSLKRDAGFKVLEGFDTQNYCGFKFTSLIVECKNYAKPDYKDLMQLFTYTLPWSDSEISKNPLCLLISRENPTIDSTTWRIRKAIFNKPMGSDTRLILFLDVDDLQKMIEYRDNGHPSTVFKEKIDEFKQNMLKTF